MLCPPSPLYIHLRSRVAGLQFWFGNCESAPVFGKKELGKKKAMTDEYSYEFFNVSFPAEWVAHVEINRPDKLNAFKEV